MRDFTKMADKRLTPDIGMDYLFYIYDRAINARSSLSALVQTRANFDTLVAKYATPVSEEPHVVRQYHDFNHIIEGVKDILSIESDCDCSEGSIDDVLLAWFYHDSIYRLNPKTTTNESESAWYALEDLVSMGFSAERAGRVHDLVMWTKHDKNPPETDYEANLIVDIDLLRIAATPVETFFGLTAMVRKEFSFVDDKAWAEGRIAFWRGFLQRKNGRVFRTSHFEHLNNIAISNIEKEVFSLERGMFL